MAIFSAPERNSVDSKDFTASVSVASSSNLDERKKLPSDIADEDCNSHRSEVGGELCQLGH
jgi:hypothetical protein